MTDPWSPLFGTDIEPYTCKDGEIVDIPVYIGNWFRSIDEERETDRIRFCAHHNLDPATFTGCHGCRGTGYHHETGWTCFCDYGARVQRRLDQDAEREFRERVKTIDFTKRSGE